MSTSEVIRIVCPNCGSKLNAKRKLLGESRPCPKCKEPVKIAILENHELLPSIPLEEPDPNHPHLVGNKTPLGNVRLIERLNRNFRYLICDRTSVLLAWANDGMGWMLKTNAGLVPVGRNPENLPTQGNFKLVELKLESREAGLHLLGLEVYQLAQRWALNCLDEGDDRICERVTGRGSLGREQKFAVRRMLRENFMPEVYERATAVLDYLANNDFHSSGVG
jgi:hypothetical protein